MEAGQGDDVVIEDEAQRELGDGRQLDVVGADATFERGLRGIARARRGRYVADERGQRADGSRSRTIRE